VGIAEWSLLSEWVTKKIGGVEFVEWLFYWNAIVEWALLNGIC
jgi:hypothetical protein